MPPPTHWLDSFTAGIAPAWTLQRQRARIASANLQRHYEAASPGRRTQGWQRIGTDGNSAVGYALAFLRATARDLVRNNPYAESALGAIVDNTIGAAGIVAKPLTPNKRVSDLWAAWAGTTACDADGVNDFAGLQALTLRTTAESGEVIVRRRFRRLDDGLPIPLQLQVLEPDFLDTSKDGYLNYGGGRIIQGVEFDGLGRRAGYWLFKEHPGSSSLSTAQSSRVPASDILHMFRGVRAGQVRAATWFASSMLKFKDFDELEDAVLMKQKVAACLAVIMSDVDGTSTPLGTTTAEAPSIDLLSPGMVINAPLGRSVDVVQPPSTTDYPAYSPTVLRAIAAGLGVTYEDMTGDYSGFSFSAARLSRLRHWRKVESWRWRMMVPKFCDPAWRWAMEAAILAGALPDAGSIPAARWTGEPMPMIEPDKEGLAHKRNVRAGITTLPEVIRERGYDPDELLEEVAGFNKKLDDLGIVFDSDPRQRTEQGQALGASVETPKAPETKEDPEAEAEQ